MTEPMQTASLLLERGMDRTRSMGPRTEAARALLLLCALRFLLKSDPPVIDEPEWRSTLREQSDRSVDAMLSRASVEIERRNPELEGVFADHLLPAVRNARSLLRDWVQDLDAVCDVFAGDAAAFGNWFDAASDSAVGRGAAGLQFSTPRKVAELMVGLVKPRPTERIHDPCAGSGGMLAAASAFLSPEAPLEALSGQEANADVAALARLRLFLRGARNVRIEVGDALREPRFVQLDTAPATLAERMFQETKLSTFDVVLCNPPYGQRLGSTEFALRDPFNRFRHGTPGKTSGEIAFLQHAVSCLNPHGRAAVLVGHGLLFRGGGDRQIRENLLREDLVEAVIGLPVGALPGLSVELALIVCRRDKESTCKSRVLFVDASDERDALESATAWRDLAAKIVAAYEKRSEQRAFSRVVNLEQIAANDYSLQPRRYVLDQEEGPSSFDLRTALAQARAYEDAAQKHAAQMDRIAAELVPMPAGVESPDAGRRPGKPLTPRDRVQSLTPRERRVLELLCSGLFNKQVAAELGVAEKTVKVHRSRLMLKMGAVSLVELVRFATDAGIDRP